MFTMEYITTCPCCNKEVHSTFKKTFCSSSCAAKYNNQRRVVTRYKINKENKEKIVTCKVCGRSFVQSGREKICSEKCKSILKLLPTLTKYFGADITMLGTENIIKEYDSIKERLYNEYWKDECTGSDIAKKYNYPSSANITGKIFKYFGIPTRSCADTNSLLFKKGLHKINNLFVYSKQQWHTTWDKKEVYLRSSYELDYAIELDKQHIVYEVETLRIKYYNTEHDTYRCAIPDFYIPKTNTVIEIKSEWTFDISEMKDKATAYINSGYNFELILEHKSYSYEELMNMTR